MAFSVMADGKDRRRGRERQSEGAAGRPRYVDAKGMTVYPGLIDPESNFGLTEVSADQMSE